MLKADAVEVRSVVKLFRILATKIKKKEINAKPMKMKLLMVILLDLRWNAGFILPISG